MKHQGRDPKQALVEQELLSWFENEIVDEALTGYRLTHVDLSRDRTHVTLWYLPPEQVGTTGIGTTGIGTTGTGASGILSESEVGDALATYRWEAQERVEEILRKRPEIRWREDRGAENKRRVESILEELREEQGKDG